MNWEALCYSIVLTILGAICACFIYRQGYRHGYSDALDEAIKTVEGVKK